MKRTLTVMLVFVLALALLAGCAGKANSTAPQQEQSAQQEQTVEEKPEPQQEPAAEPEQDAPQEAVNLPTYTPDEIRENNSVKNVLSRHNTMTYTRTFTDGEGNVNGTVREQFTMNDGFLQTNSDYTDETGSVVYSNQGYADSTYAGASYGLSSDGTRNMTLYPDNETYESFADLWIAAADDESVTEAVTDTSEQDGAVIVTTRTDYRDEADLYAVTLYYVDPETDDLLYMEVTSYNTQNDAVVAVTKTEISYDAPATFEAKPFEAIITSSDYCEVSLIVNPQRDDMHVFWYPVAHGTEVGFAPLSDYTLYTDEELTQEIDPTVGIDISGEACNIFAVPRQG